MRGTGPMSFAVMTARTPAMASAAAASTAATWPCATGLRRMAACSMLTRFKSPTNWPRPRSKRASSIRSTGLPIHRFVPIMVCQPPGRQRALRALLRRSRYSWCCGTSCQTRAAREWLLGRARADDIGDHQEQVGVAGLLAGCGQHSVDLPTVMCLVVEEVGHQQPQRCADLAVGSPAEPGEVLGEPCVVDLVRRCEIPASAFSRSARNTAKSSIMPALCLIGVPGLGQASKRDIHCWSPHKI